MVFKPCERGIQNLAGNYENQFDLPICLLCLGGDQQAGNSHVQVWVCFHRIEGEEIVKVYRGCGYCVIRAIHEVDMWMHAYLCMYDMGIYLELTSRVHGLACVWNELLQAWCLVHNLPSLLLSVREWKAMSILTCIVSLKRLPGELVSIPKITDVRATEKHVQVSLLATDKDSNASNDPIHVPW